MAGLAGKSGPPGNQNAFRHGLAGISQRRNNGALNPAEHSIREENSGWIARRQRRRRADQHRVLAEIIASDASLLIIHLTRPSTASSRTIRKPDKIPKRWLNWTHTKDRWLGRYRQIFRGSGWKELQRSKACRKSSPK